MREQNNNRIESSFDSISRQFRALSERHPIAVAKVRMNDRMMLCRRLKYGVGSLTLYFFVCLSVGAAVSHVRRHRRRREPRTRCHDIFSRMFANLILFVANSHRHSPFRSHHFCDHHPSTFCTNAHHFVSVPYKLTYGGALRCVDERTARARLALLVLIS